MQHFVGPTMRTLLGLFIALAGVLLILRVLPPNRWIGLCTKRTTANLADWHKAHRALGWVVLPLGLAISLMSMWPTYPVHRALPLACVLVVGVAIAWVYRRYAA